MRMASTTLSPALPCICAADIVHTYGCSCQSREHAAVTAPAADVRWYTSPVAAWAWAEDGKETRA